MAYPRVDFNLILAAGVLGRVQSLGQLLQLLEAGRILLPPLFHGGLLHGEAVGAMLVHEGYLVLDELVPRREVGFQLGRGVGRDARGRRHDGVFALLLGDDLRQLALPLDQVGVLLAELDELLRTKLAGGALFP